MSGDSFLALAEPIVRKVLENIESPYVWMPLGLVILGVLAYPVTKMKIFPYLSVAFLIIAFGADWVGRYHNRQTPPEPNPQTAGYRDEVFRYLADVQVKAVEMLAAGKADASRTLTNKNLQAVDKALDSFPDDADFHALMGYTLKDLYQGSKNSLSTPERKAYLSHARTSFENALQLDPQNASAHNGMGNVLFFEGRFDEAIREHDRALKLTHGNYPAAEHDRRLVIAVRNGEIPFDF